MAYINEYIATGASEKRRFSLQGNYFRVLSLSSNAPSLEIEFYKNRTLIEGGFKDCGPGFAYHADGGFDEIVIANSITQQIRFVVTNNETTYGEVTTLQGTAEFAARSAPVYGQAVALIGTEDIELLPSRSVRRWLLIQNKSATATLWINLAGNTATQGTGLKLPPGGYWESSPAFCPNNAIRALADAAGCSVLIVEGI